MKAQTSCKGCVFAIEQESQQTGCELYRSEKCSGSKKSVKKRAEIMKNELCSVDDNRSNK